MARVIIDNGFIPTQSVATAKLITWPEAKIFSAPISVIVRHLSQKRRLLNQVTYTSWDNGVKYRQAFPLLLLVNTRVGGMLTKTFNKVFDKTLSKTRAE